MDQRIGYSDVRPFLPFALSVTFGVVVLPAAIVLAVTVLAQDGLSVVLALALAACIVLLAAGAGSLLWSRHPESERITFGELMLWGWLRRRRAEQRVAEHELVLDLDADGQPSDKLMLSKEQRLAILRDLSSALETKDLYTHGHSKRVERHVLRTGRELGLEPKQLERLANAAALHDVGKIRTPDGILRKPSSLTEEERAVLQDHVQVGSRLVSLVGNSDVVDGVRHHHERWDGRGYPDGMSGADIPLFARIIAVADAYDAMTSSRPYRASFAHALAVETLEREAGRQFDPVVVEAFLATLPSRVPVASLFMPAGLSDLWRRASAWAHTTGADSLATAAAAAGVALFVGGTLLSPGAVDRSRASTPDVSAPIEAPMGDATESGDSAEKSAGVEAEDAGAVERPESGDATAASDDDGPQVLGERLERGRRDGREQAAPSDSRGPAGSRLDDRGLRGPDEARDRPDRDDGNGGGRDDGDRDDGDRDDDSDGDDDSDDSDDEGDDDSDGGDGDDEGDDDSGDVGEDDGDRDSDGNAYAYGHRPHVDPQSDRGSDCSSWPDRTGRRGNNKHCGR